MRNDTKEIRDSTTCIELITTGGTALLQSGLGFKVLAQIELRHSLKANKREF